MNAPASSLAASSEPGLNTNIDFFSHVPTLVNLLSNPSMIPQPLSWHTAADSTSETLFGLTLHTPTTIPHFFALVPKPSTAKVESLTALLHLGTDVGSHPGICHGGIIGTVLDELMGALVVIYNEHKKQTVTASLTVNFLKPVPLPGIIMIKAEIEKVEGRKIFTFAEILVVDDTTAADIGEERPSVTSKGLFIELKNSEVPTGKPPASFEDQQPEEKYHYVAFVYPQSGRQ